jgi:hypothetical protein
LHDLVSRDKNSKVGFKSRLKRVRKKLSKIKIEEDEDQGLGGNVGVDQADKA